jgi:hypothetical protein
MTAATNRNNFGRLRVHCGQAARVPLFMLKSLVDRVFPLWLKIAAVMYLVGFIVIQAYNFGFSNFLWFSCLGLIGMTIALVFESRLLASMMLLMVFVPDEISWGGDFFIALLTGWHPFDATIYMFDEQYPLFIRTMSLFHIVVPLVLGWMVYRLRYDTRALPAQTLLCAVILLVSYNITAPASNINCAFGLWGVPQTSIHPWLYLAIVMISAPLMFYLPVHLLLVKLGWHRIRDAEMKKHETN